MPKTIRVVVEMHGGTISNVHTDAREIELDVVFTDTAKYIAERPVAIGSGRLAKAMIYTREGSQLITKADMNAVFRAVRKYEAL